ncbi:MAG: type I DNA topoisomerase [Elusimicrobiota bacterium]
MKLVIVESPTKEKTISKFLPKDYTVKSSFGHVRDLPKSELGVDIANDFKPTYEQVERAKKMIPTLRELASKAETVVLATDYDREGESIAWHLKEELNISEDRIKRITFHEITKSAIIDALKTPRAIDYNLVNAQQARRILDRIVGYKISPVLWQRIKGARSAGRVQSVALRLLANREKEIREFKPEEYWTIKADLLTGTQPEKQDITGFTADLVEYESNKIEKFDIKTEQQAKSAVDKLSPGKFVVDEVTAKEKTKRPAPPFITSTLQQEASRKIGFQSRRTMKIAQELYEGISLESERVGLITYHRTDSVTTATVAIDEVRGYITKNVGIEYLPDRPVLYQTKSKTAQEAHEAIRPTSVNYEPEKIKARLSPDQYKLYNLIWQRFVASQMKEAIFDTTAVNIGVYNKTSGVKDGMFRATGQVVKFAGFLKVYNVEADEDNEETDKSADESTEDTAKTGKKDKFNKKLPVLVKSQVLKQKQLLPEQHFTEPPPRYNEASIIKELEKNGIGRPSTYATIISTIIDRKYCELLKRAFHVTGLGEEVNKLMEASFPDIVDINFTANMEQDLDSIAEGKDEWTTVLKRFYKPFSKALDIALASKQERIVVAPTETNEKCPKCGSMMVIRDGKYGKFMSCKNFPACRYAIAMDANGNKRVPIPTNEKCDVCGLPMEIMEYRFGKSLRCTGYPKCQNRFALDRDGNKKIKTKTDIKCEKCGSMMWLRENKKGKFLTCSAFPKCRNLKKYTDPSAVIATTTTPEAAATTTTTKKKGRKSKKAAK